MIHSMAGGKLQEIDFVNLAKVEIVDGCLLYTSDAADD